MDDEKKRVEYSVEEASPTTDADDQRLQELGYTPSFKREFTNLATVSDDCCTPSNHRL